MYRFDLVLRTGPLEEETQLRCQIFIT
uniref:Uncharacterized protein n=1 Tax=Arundo donax TaxID=35708 RepID=A0A0A9HRJ5_ARUDO